MILCRLVGRYHRSERHILPVLFPGGSILLGNACTRLPDCTVSRPVEHSVKIVNISRTFALMCLYEGWWESNALHFLSETTITIVMKFTYILGTYFINSRIFVHSLLHYQHTLPPLYQTLYTRRVKLFAEASKLCMHAVSARRQPRNGVLGM